MVDAWVWGDRLWGARGDGEGGEEDADEGEDGGCDEEAEHPERCDAGDGEGVGDVGRQGDYFVSIGPYSSVDLVYILVAPESNSLRRILTGLNQYNVSGSEQCVMPSLE